MRFKVRLFAFLFAILFVSFLPFSCQKCENETTRRTSRSAKMPTFESPPPVFSEKEVSRRLLLLLNTFRQASASDLPFETPSQLSRRSVQPCLSQNTRTAPVSLPASETISSSILAALTWCLVGVLVTFATRERLPPPRVAMDFAGAFLRDFFEEVQPMGCSMVFTENGVADRIEKVQ